MLEKKNFYDKLIKNSQLFRKKVKKGFNELI